MLHSYKISRAIKFATKTHEVYQKQKRKGKDIAYITHPLTVGLILSRAGADEDTIVAGILHDTIEDSTKEKKVTPKMLEERFGKEVAELVVSVTEMNKELPWEERKKEALEHIKTFSHNSLLVKSADIISNLTELIEDYEQDGDKTFERFNASKENTIQNYLQVISAIVGQWFESPLKDDLTEVEAQLESIGPDKLMKNVLLAAYVEDKPSWHVPVYIVNTNLKPVALTIAQHSIQSDEDNVLDLGMSDYRETIVPANEVLEIDRMTDMGELDFLTEYWVRHGGKEYLVSFSGMKMYFGPRGKLPIPILNRDGYIDYFLE